MTRSEVWWVNVDPPIGGEITKTRPAVIVSNDASNRHLVKPTTQKALEIETVVIQLKESKTGWDDRDAMSAMQLKTKN